MDTYENTNTFTVYVKGERITTTTACAAYKEPKQREIGMEYICEAKDYNVAEFEDHFQNKLPQLVKVVQGYCGEIASDVFDRDQVISLQAVSRQHRVISKFKVETYKNRLFSIPSTYFEKLCIVNKNGKAGDEQFMFEILRECHLPQTVRFPKDRTITVGNNSVSTNNIPNIELIQMFDEVSLLGNFINDGEMCTDLVHVPLYLSHLRMAVVTGIKGYSPSQWQQFNEKLNMESQYVEYDLEFGNPDIAEYDPNAIHTDATYTYVEPRIYSNIVNIMQRPVVRSLPADESEQTKYDVQRQQIAEGIDQEHGDVYEEIQSVSNTTKPQTADFTKELQLKQKTGLRSVKAKSQITTQHNKAAPIVPPKPKLASVPMKQNQAPPALPQRHSTAVRTPNPQKQMSHDYSNNVPRTEVQPTVHDKRTSTQRQHLQTETAEQKTNLAVESSTTVSNVSNSDDVAKLTIDEVIAYLKKLGLGHYENTFREQMIDGVILLELDKSMLRDDFGMKGSEVVRLTRFATDGHIPS